MTKINKRIEIVASMDGSLNSMGLISRREVRSVLLRYYTSVEITLLSSVSDLRKLAVRKPDLVFLGMKYIPSAPEIAKTPYKIWLSEYLDDNGITYTGSGAAAIELELNKDLAKQRLLEAGLRTARFMAVEPGATVDHDTLDLTYPLFVKPISGGGGAGIDNASLVHTYTQLTEKVRSLYVELGSGALVEEYLPGREFSVGLLRNAESYTYNLMPIELVAPINPTGERFLSAKVKTDDTEHHLAVRDAHLAANLNKLALNAFKVLGAQDYGRIDIRLDATGTPHFLEANLLPSLLDNYGNFPKTCLLNKGLSHEAIILSIVQLAFERAKQPVELSLDTGDELLATMFPAAFEAA